MRATRPVARAAAALTLVLALGACSQNDNGNNTLTNQTPGGPTTPAGAPASTGAAEAPSGTVKLDAKDNLFDPKDVQAKAGHIVIEMKNAGAAPHTFTQGDLKVDVAADAGKTVTIDIPDAKPGTYKFVCKYHESIGMVGNLTVT